jgi:hypothetical protein
MKVDMKLDEISKKISQIKEYSVGRSMASGFQHISRIPSGALSVKPLNKVMPQRFAKSAATVDTLFYGDEKIPENHNRLRIAPMTGIGFLCLVLLAIIGAICLSPFCTSANAAIQVPGSAAASPAITLNAPPPSATTLSGYVSNANPDIVKVVVYVFTNAWYVQPFANAPYTSIAPDGSWTTFTHPWNQIVALVVDPSLFDPSPVLYTHPSLQAGVLAWTEYPILTFSGYTWAIKAGTFDPGANSWSSDPSVVHTDKDGLHLKITQIDGRWQCGEVSLTRSLGYGTYTVQIGSRLDQLDRNTVAAPLFTYAMPGQELDFEFSGAGGLIPMPNNGQFVVQPWTTPDNMVRYVQPAVGQFTAQMEWKADHVTFRTWTGWDTTPAPSDIIHQWTYTGPNIPPPGQERVHINLWLLNGQAPLSGVGDEMIIKSFTFLPPEFTGDFETGLADWSIDNGVWAIGTAAGSCHGGTQCAATGLGGNYPADTDSTLIGAPVYLCGTDANGQVHLKFWSRWSYAASDYGQVLIQTYDETTHTGGAWTPIGPSFANVSPWTLKDIDITAYLGKTVRIGFAHVATCASGDCSDVSTGWVIDDIQITGVTPLMPTVTFTEYAPPPTVSVLGATATPVCGGSITYAWDAPDGGETTATGTPAQFTPPASPHFCPYRVRVRAISDQSHVSSPTKTVLIYTRLPGDANGDKTVNALDLLQVRNHFMQSGAPGWTGADLNCDGTVNALDLTLIRNYFMRTE